MATTDEGFSPEKQNQLPLSSAENQGAFEAACRDDAVDLSMQEHENDVMDDAVTNPVEQTNKRARTKVSEGGFLASDKPADKDSSGKTFQDEQIALYQKQMHDE